MVDSSLGAHRAGEYLAFASVLMRRLDIAEERLGQTDATGSTGQKRVLVQLGKPRPRRPAAASTDQIVRRGSMASTEAAADEPD